MILRLFVFLVINFGALAIGGSFTNSGVNSEWYASLEKAPWTPPGWVFGAAWTTIMICFSIYLARLWSVLGGKKTLIVFFGIQFILNVGWNPLFFYFHVKTIALIVILALTAIVGAMLLKYRPLLGYWTWLIVPYFLWLIIACSLNAYVI